MKTSLKAGFAQIFSCCPKNLSCPKFGGAAAPLAPPARTPMFIIPCDDVSENCSKPPFKESKTSGPSKNYIQSNLSNTDTEGTEQSVRIRKVYV